MASRMTLMNFLSGKSVAGNAAENPSSMLPASAGGVNYHAIRDECNAVRLKNLSILWAVMRWDWYYPFKLDGNLQDSRSSGRHRHSF
jgi:hypothetical protein